MSEMKTLKDIGDEPYLKWELIEEAKKWRWALYGKINEAIKCATGIFIPSTEILYYMGQIHWITEFFNLEDEDK